MNVPDFNRLLNEAVFKAVTSGGKGGQNVNKVATRVELYFDIDKSTVLSAEQKIRLKEKLSNRISEEGLLRITSSEGRTQLTNKEKVKKKFTGLITSALHQQKIRKESSPSRESKEERLRMKKIKSELKKLRNWKME
jgi:ribosome-associated protein